MSSTPPQENFDDVARGLVSIIDSTGKVELLEFIRKKSSDFIPSATLYFKIDKLKAIEELKTIFESTYKIIVMKEIDAFRTSKDYSLESLYFIYNEFFLDIYAKTLKWKAEELVEYKNSEVLKYVFQLLDSKTRLEKGIKSVKDVNRQNRTALENLLNEKARKTYDSRIVALEKQILTKQEKHQKDTIKKSAKFTKEFIKRLLEIRRTILPNFAKSKASLFGS